MTNEQRYDECFVRRLETDVYGFTWDYLLRHIDWEIFEGAETWLENHDDPIR